MDRIPLLCQGKRIGEAEAERQSLYLCLRIRAPRRNGLWCAWAVGSAGEMRIGTLEPSGIQAEIVRRFSRQSLAPIGDLLRVELRPVGASPVSDMSPIANKPPAPNTPVQGMSPPVSQWKHADANPLRETRFQRQIRNIHGVLERQERDRRCLAFPIENAFPIPELFCFARARRIGGQNYWVFAFDSRQRPVL